MTNNLTDSEFHEAVDKEVIAEILANLSDPTALKNHLNSQAPGAKAAEFAKIVGYKKAARLETAAERGALHS